MPLDPRLDFRDDGGTRAWRANQATYGRVIDVGRPRPFDKWRKAPVTHVLAAILLAGWFLPWAILIGGIVLLAVWDRLTGT